MRVPPIRLHSNHRPRLLTSNANPRGNAKVNSNSNANSNSNPNTNRSNPDSDPFYDDGPFARPIREPAIRARLPRDAHVSVSTNPAELYVSMTLRKPEHILALYESLQKFADMLDDE